MKNLDFNEGYKEYSINSDENRILRVNTSDMNILSRMSKVEKELQKIADECSKINNDDMALDAITKLDKNVRKQINYIFDGDVSDIIFGNVNCISIAGGKPIFENFLDAILPIIKDDIANEQKNLENKIERYTSKLK